MRELSALELLELLRKGDLCVKWWSETSPEEGIKLGWMVITSDVDVVAEGLGDAELIEFLSESLEGEL